MPYLVDQLPFYDQPTAVRIPGGPVVPIKDHQIVVWVSVTEAGIASIPPDTPRFPAVVDTGFNHNFLIQNQHLTDWADIERPVLPLVSHLLARGDRVPLHDADVWIHHNQAGFRDQLSDVVSAFRLELDNGIAVCPDAMSYPRLPLLGVRALKQNRLELTVNCAASHVAIRTP